MFIRTVMGSLGAYPDPDILSSKSYFIYEEYYIFLKGVCFRNFRSMEARTGFPFRELARPHQTRTVYKIDEPSQYKRLMFEQLLV